MMRKFFGVLVILALGVFAGCGKKKESVEVKKQAEADVMRLAEQENSFVFDDGDENFKLEEFSFVEDEEEQKEEGAPAQRVAEGEAADLLPEDADDLPVELEPVHFGFDSDNLLKKDKTVFEENLRAAKHAAEEGKEVAVRAYCCEIGSPDYNQALSERRAQAIKKEMIAHGVDQKKINAVGCGQENQVAWSDAQDRLTRIRELSPNRRAEFEFVRGA